MYRTIFAGLAIGALAASAALASPDDRLLVCDWSSASVVAYDAGTGSGEGVLVTAGSGGLGQPHSVRQGPDGALYVTSVGSNRVLRYRAADGVFLGVFVNPTGTPLNAPTDAVFGPDGQLYVASFNNGRVLRFDGQTGAFLGTFAVGDGAGRVEMLAWGPDGHLYATTGHGNSVVRFDGTTGASMGEFITTGLGGLDDPHGFTFGPDGHLYVSSFGSPLVVKFDGLTGALLDDFGVADDPLTPQDDTGGLVQPHGLAFDAAGRLYACSFGTGQVLRYDGATGAFIDAFAAGGVGQPTHLTFALDGDANGDGAIDVDDLVLVFERWGACPAGSLPCPGDVNGDGQVSVDDLVEVIRNWS